MEDLLADLVDAARRHAPYADARHVASTVERIGTRNGRIDELEHESDEGIGVRVRLGGRWGFAATNGLDRAAGEDAVRRALALAEAQPPGRGGDLAPEPPARGHYATELEIDPFGVPLEQKLEALLAAETALGRDERLVLTRAHFLASKRDQTFVSSEGARCSQRIVACGGGIAATAAGGGETQTRSYPGSHRGDVAQAGYEHFLALDLIAHAPRVAEEALALLDAPACPGERTTLLLDGEQLALQLHESVGHAVELDRMLGSEISYAGGSFIGPSDLGELRYGSEQMSVSADGTVPGGLGTFGWDDEGVAAQRVPIVTAGRLTGVLSSREAAAEIGLERSGGAMRAEGFARQPLVRMTNVNLHAGEAGTLEDLVAATDRGILMETNRSWSIDSQRLHFQFGCEIAWEIEDGRRRRMLRNPSYAGVTPRFWAGLDAVCSASDWRLWGVLNCGKGEPGQIMSVSHGTAPARFRDVQVGIA